MNTMKKLAAGTASLNNEFLVLNVVHINCTISVNNLAEVGHE